MTMVIILSTSSSEKDKLAAYNLNVAGYITKSRASKDFGLLAKLLNAYWRLIEFPPA
jgi:DNA-binding NarL/FixJ family response regulator